ncbi:MAG: LamG-like jellyroll fold domain-containing protein, partial [Candidatus Aminicenantales bacterium]
NVSIDFELGDAAAKQYALTLSVPGKEKVKTTLPFGHSTFRNATWFGISSTSDERAIFYVDNLILGAAGSEKVAKAADSLSIKGRAEPAPRARPALTDPDMLAGYWKFDENGSDLVDSSANGLNGELGNVQRAKGRFGRALFLDGSGGAAAIPDSPLLQFGGGDFSIECWLDPIALDVASEHKRRRVIEKSGYPGTTWNVDLWTDGRVMMEMADQRTTSGNTISAGTIPEKKWTHLVIAVDRKGFQPRTFTGHLDVPGKPLSTGTWQQFIGMIAELKIYRRLLHPAEIRAGYEKAKDRYASAAYTVIPDD